MYLLKIEIERKTRRPNLTRVSNYQWRKPRKQRRRNPTTQILKIHLNRHRLRHHLPAPMKYTVHRNGGGGVVVAGIAMIPMKMKAMKMMRGARRERKRNEGKREEERRV